MSDPRPPVSGEPRTARRFEDDAPDGRISDVGGESALIATLSDAMAEKLARNRGKRHWNDAAPNYLIERLRQEVDELEQAIGCYLEEGSADEDDVWSEAADVGNFAAMLADNATGRSEARAEVLDGTAKSQEARATAPPTYLNPSQVRTVVEVMARSLLRRYPQLRVSVPELMTGLDIAIEEARLSEQPGADS